MPGGLDAEGLEWIGGGEGGDGILGRGYWKKLQHAQASGALRKHVATFFARTLSVFSIRMPYQRVARILENCAWHFTDICKHLLPGFPSTLRILQLLAGALYLCVGFLESGFAKVLS